MFQLVTGYFGFTNGRSGRAWILWLHGIGAYALVVLLYWKSSIILDAWQRKKTWTGRRLFLGTAVSTLAGLILWRAFDWSKDKLDVPGAQRRFTGSYETGSFSSLFPVVSWIADRPAPVAVEAWRLVIDGAVKRSLVFTYDQLTKQGNSGSSPCPCSKQSAVTS